MAVTLPPRARSNVSRRSGVISINRRTPQLLGIVPVNNGGFGAADTAANVFARNEIEPLQARFMELNAWLGEDVLRFTPYELGATGAR